MEIKDVFLPINAEANVSSIQSPSEKKTKIESVTEEQLSADTLDISIRLDTVAKSVKISEANSSITSLHTLQDSTTSLKSVLQSIDGISLQAEVAPSEHREKLAKEVIELAKAATKIADSLKYTELNTVTGDRTKLQIEKTLTKVLENILPSSSEGGNSFGISNKDAILNTRLIVARTQAQIEALQIDVHSAFESAKDSAAHARSGENPIQSNDVPEAFRTGNNLQESIISHPQLALDSIKVPLAEAFPAL